MSLDDKDDALHDCIYGGPNPVEVIEERLATAGIAFPVMTSVRYEADFVNDWAGWAFRPGDGLVYQTAAARPGRGDEWRLARDPLEWQWSLQQCIVELRRRNLPATGIDTRPEAEARFRQLALQHCQTARPPWREAVTCWSDVVLRQTDRKIHDTQRAFLRFLLDASVPLDTIGVVGHRFHHAMQQLLASFSPSALIHWLMQGLEIAQEQLVRQNRRLDEPMRRALAYVQAHLAESLSLENVAGAIPMSSAAFSRKFKSVMGQTYTDYIQAVRLERAIPLLLRTNRTVLDIALDCGFGSVEQFHRVFKQRMGVTPLAYRHGRVTA
ncbi:helix-turn-helix transcriptional regulator [Cerasicoccus arenae]|uniref:HTH araC/xylS-type domain-containing protein n=1 Tax=Cerasicoccus arenae TaxID=424488 RepID=A0A8J3GE82_9BACT|nr:AraC family transcriptional regulator [Cerasicoccus arenae]MBK1858780.1 helix-turn-helix transcriptional regulator [Cerasicoccus arenae]GHC07411.1 hypothetical protein GCM10007047_25730 [Cerasicoccus arenae]